MRDTRPGKTRREGLENLRLKAYRTDDIVVGGDNDIRGIAHRRHSPTDVRKYNHGCEHRHGIQLHDLTKSNSDGRHQQDRGDVIQEGRDQSREKAQCTDQRPNFPASYLKCPRCN